MHVITKFEQLKTKTKFELI